ncbi:MAG: hypothetical protein OHK0052_20590 [Anaerolineales bacterium]
MNINLTEWFWQFTDAAFIDRLADAWQRTITSLSKLYFLAFLALTAIFGIIAYFMDLRPSMQFAAHVINSTETGIPANIAQMLVIGLTLTPTLIEMFATGLALAGSRAIKFTLFAALTFDAVTDTPGAYALAQISLNHFLPAEFIATNPTIYAVISWAAAIAILPFATIVIETLFMSCLLAAWRMFKTSIERDQTRPRPPAPKAHTFGGSYAPAGD